MKVSIIIPTYNEAEHIGRTIRYLAQNGNGDYVQEIIVADGGSTDDTVQIAIASGATVVRSKQKGRAAQMNCGAAIATGGVLYFLHADTIPPLHYTTLIIAAIKKGYKSGCFRLQFDHHHWFLKANCWFTRFNMNQFRFGDQSLFIEAAIFKRMGGFNESLIVMEDQEMTKRISRSCRFRVLPEAVTTSARKYLLNGIYKTQAVYYLIYVMYQLGFSQQKLVNTYRAFIVQDKL
jgi:rSAM/selenodomain-associated transferase 2